MKAPDKIFLAFDHGFVAQSSNIKEDINGNSIFLPQYIPIEYIRKDALLEWAKEKIEWYEETDFSSVYQKVIDKIKSL